MRRLLILGLVIQICFIACARERHYVSIGKTPSKRLIVLPEKSKDPTFRPYIVNGERYYPIPDAEGFVQTGIASWYGKKFHGRFTANGEVFDMYKKSAAHKTLPLGTYVKVIKLSDKTETIVRVNDRGPFVKGRIIDLSYAAAKEIGLVGPGVANVKVIALGRQVAKLESPVGLKPVVEIRDLNQGEFTIQVGAFKDRKNALTLADRLKVLFEYVDIQSYEDEDEGTIYRVRVSKAKTLIKAGENEKRLESMGFEGAFIVRL